MFNVSRVAFRLIFRLPRGPVIFFSWARYFFSQIDDAKVRNHGCGSRMIAAEKNDLFSGFFSGWRSFGQGHLSKSEIRPSKIVHYKINILIFII